MRAENRHYTEKWHEKRKDHLGDKCHNPHCGICSYHKQKGNSAKYDRRCDRVAKDVMKFEKRSIA